MDFKDYDAIIDARTPSEYAEDHVPGAVSAPVLDDTQRAEVGTLYKQVSPFEAKKRGAALLARNIASHIENQFAGKPKGWRPLVYCWRGGKRSGAMACVLLETPLATRVTLLLEEYQHFVADRASLEAQLDCLSALHGRERIAQWKALAAQGAWRDFVGRLLTEHYDDAYRRSAERNFPQ